MHDLNSNAVYKGIYSQWIAMIYTYHSTIIFKSLTYFYHMLNLHIYFHTWTMVSAYQETTIKPSPCDTHRASNPCLLTNHRHTIRVLASVVRFTQQFLDSYLWLNQWRSVGGRVIFNESPIVSFLIEIYNFMRPLLALVSQRIDI